MRLLIVDDSEDARDVLMAALASGGYEDVVAVGSGAEALDVLGVGDDKAGGSDIDLVLMDIIMPVMDGIEACARIRQDARYQDLPLVMVTGMDDMSSLAQAFVVGAYDYVVKPFQTVELLVRVRNALKLKGELDRRLRREESLRIANDRLLAAIEPPIDAIDRDTGFLSRAAFERGLHDAAAMGWVAALQIDALPDYEQLHGIKAADVLSRRLAGCVGATRGPMGAMLCAYAEGVVTLALPSLTEDETRAILQDVRGAVLDLAVPHRGRPAGVVTVSGAYSPNGPAPNSHGLAHALTGLAAIAANGGDRLELHPQT